MRALQHPAVAQGTRRVIPYALATLAGTLLFLPGVSAYFVADDWPLLLRNAGLSARDLGMLFTQVRYGWYRPLFDLWIALNGRLFGLHPAGYHLAALALYGLVCALVGEVAEYLTGERSTGVAAALFFAVMGAHAEAVLWISAGNELLAGLWVIVSFRAYLAYRRGGRARWLGAAFAAFVLSLASKETAATLPLLLVAYELRPGGWRTLRTLLPLAPFIALGAAFVLFRLCTGSPYPVTVSLPRLAMNLSYYGALELLALPDNFAYLASLPLWRQEPWTPLAALAPAMAGLALLGRLLWRRRMPALLGLGLSWALIALLPTLLTVTARTSFISSMGVAWAVAAAWAALRQQAARRHWALLALALLVGAQLYNAAYRSYWWRQAGHTSQRALEGLALELRDLPPQQEVWLLNIPDHVRYAYVFRNAFPAAGEWLYPGRRVEAIVDRDLQGASRAEVVARTAAGRPGAAILWYADGGWERIRDP